MSTAQGKGKARARKAVRTAKAPSQVRVRVFTAEDGTPCEHAEAPSRPWSPMRHRYTYPAARVRERLGHAEGPLEIWQNLYYSCSVRRFATGFPLGEGPFLILGITHVSQRAIHDFRDLQRIKNDICGPEWEGVELYPAESRLVDPSNCFYLWCVPKGVIPWGLPQRRVLTLAQAIAPQRPFPEEP